MALNNSSGAGGSELYNVFNYGAVGNGGPGGTGADDGPAIKAAMTAAAAAAPANGQVDVWLPPGYTYRIATRPPAKSGVRLRMYGAAIYPDWGGLGVNGIFDVGGTLSRFGIAGGSFFGTGTEAQNNIIFQALNGITQSWCRFRDIYATGFASSLIYNRNCQHVYVDDCEFPNNNFGVTSGGYNVINFVNDAGAPQALGDLRVRNSYFDGTNMAAIAIACNLASNIPNLGFLAQGNTCIGNPASTGQIGGSIDFETLASAVLYSGVRIIGNLVVVTGGTGGPNPAAINFPQNMWGRTIVDDNDIIATQNANCAAFRFFSPDVVCTNNRVNASHSDYGTAVNSVAYSSNIRNGGPLSGVATLVAGTVTVNTPEVLSTDANGPGGIILSRTTSGGTTGNLSVGAIVNATSFVINSSNAADTSKVYWQINH